MSDIKKKASQKLVAEIDEIEVACIIAETCCGMLRPPGQTAFSALQEIKSYSPQAHKDFTTAAHRVLLYIQNQLQKASSVS